MHTILTMIAGILYFFGGLIVYCSWFGSVTFNDQPATSEQRFMVMIVGMIILVVATFLYKI